MICGDALHLSSILEKEVDSDIIRDPETFRVTCMVSNTLGILPEAIRGLALKELLATAGPGGRSIIICYHQKFLRTGYEQFYSKQPQLCGECTEADFDYKTGNFKSSTTDYTSHWFSQEELTDMIRANSPFAEDKVALSFKFVGVGIFAICDIAADAVVQRTHS